MAHYEDEYPVIRLATHEDMIDIRTKLDRLEEIVRISHNADAIAAKKRAFQDGFNECNTEAIKFCRFMIDLLSVMSEKNIIDFFGSNETWEIYHRLEHIGLIRWDDNIKTWVEVVKK